MNGKKKLQIFVSSTYTDLKEERQAAVEAILKAGHIPAGMELFTSGNQSQMTTIRRWIDESDAYMLILGGRYGSIEAESGLSYTELEYDYAVTQEIPTFAVVIKEDALQHKVKSLGAGAIETENAQKLRAFRDKVLSNMSSFFEDHKDIKLTVHETLADFLRQHDFVGWVRAQDVPDIAPFLSQITNLTQRDNELSEMNKSLAVELAKLRKESPEHSSVGEYEELFATLNSINFEYDMSDYETMKMSALAYLLIYRDKLINGVAGPTSRLPSRFEDFLYFKVFPTLLVHGLAEEESNGNVVRKKLSRKGLGLLAYVDKHNMREKLIGNLSDPLED